MLLTPLSIYIPNPNQRLKLLNIHPTSPPPSLSVYPPTLTSLSLPSLPAFTKQPHDQHNKRNHRHKAHCSHHIQNPIFLQIAAKFLLSCFGVFNNVFNKVFSLPARDAVFSRDVSEFPWLGAGVVVGVCLLG